MDVSVKKWIQVESFHFSFIPHGNYSDNPVGEIMKQQHHVGLNFTGNGINDENHQRETSVGLRAEHLRCLGRLRKGCGGYRSGVRAGKEALQRIKVVNCVFSVVGG